MSHDKLKWKWGHLKKLYYRKKDNMGARSTGAARFDFAYFEEMDEIFRNYPSVIPPHLASSSKPLKEITNDTNKSLKSDEEICDPQPSTSKKQKGSTPKRKPSEKLFSLLENMNADRQQRHDELMNFLKSNNDRFLEVMNKMTEKQ